MNRCRICGYEIKKLKTFCDKHDKIINDVYYPDSLLNKIHNVDCMK